MTPELFPTTYWVSAFERRVSPTYLQLMKKLRKKAKKIARKKNGQRSWLVKP